MLEENNDAFSHLIEKEINSKDKIYKPDFSQKAGREFLAFYLQSKFKQLQLFDSKSELPVFRGIKDDFILKFSQRLILQPNKRIMIGITGESASGKSTICSAISNIITSFDMPVTVLTTDNYFNDISELIKKYGSFDALRDSGYDIDSPDNLQMNILKADLEQLSIGNDVYAPEYLPNGTGISVPHAKWIASNKIIVVEGMATMYEAVKDIFDIKVYVETSPEIRKERFLRRAYKERNQDLENAKKHWEYVLGAGRKYVKPARPEADLILDGETNIQYFKHILEYLHTITNNFKNND